MVTRIRFTLVALIVAVAAICVADRVTHAQSAETWMRAYVDEAYVYPSGGTINLLVNGWGFGCGFDTTVNIYVDNKLVAADAYWFYTGQIDYTNPVAVITIYQRLDVPAAFAAAGWDCLNIQNGYVGRLATVDVTGLAPGVHSVQILVANTGRVQASDGLQFFTR